MHASLTKKSHRTLLAIAAVCLAATLPVRAVTLTIGFDDTGLEPGTYVNGSDGYGAYHCGQVRFDNNYNFQYHSWDGFALSRVNNPTVGAGKTSMPSGAMVSIVATAGAMPWCSMAHGVVRHR